MVVGLMGAPEQDLGLGLGCPDGLQGGYVAGMEDRGPWVQALAGEPLSEAQLSVLG